MAQETPQLPPNEIVRGLTPQDLAELNARYDQNIFQKGRNQVLESGLVAGDLWALLKDEKYSLDINCELPPDALETIEEKVLNPFRRLLLELGIHRRLVFPKSWRHMTLITPISSGTPSEKRVINVRNPQAAERYHQAVTEALADAHPFKLTFSRLGLTTGTPQKPSGILLGGIPETNAIEQTRIGIKAKLDEKGLPHTITGIPDIYHVVLWRCTDPISQEGSKRIVELVESLDRQEIWTGKIDKVMFGSGGWLMGKHNTKVYDYLQLK